MSTFVLMSLHSSWLDFFYGESRAVDPNSLNLDLDPEFLSNLDPAPGFCINFERKMLNFFEQFTFKKYFFFYLTRKKILAPEEIFSQLSL